MNKPILWLYLSLVIFALAPGRASKGQAYQQTQTIPTLAAPHAIAQKAAGSKTRTRSARATPKNSKGQTKSLAEVAKESRANLLSASRAYRASLEKLLELQRQDESRAMDFVEKRKELFALGVIFKPELEAGELALLEVQGKIAETLRRIAEVDLKVAEVNEAEALDKAFAARAALYPDKITTAEAKNYTGETATVCGVVASAHYDDRSRGKPTILNLDRPSPNTIFTAVIWDADRPKFGQPERELQQKRICVTGKIEEFRGTPEIILRDRAQLKVE